MGRPIRVGPFEARRRRNWWRVEFGTFYVTTIDLPIDELPSLARLVSKMQAATRAKRKGRRG